MSTTTALDGRVLAASLAMAAGVPGSALESYGTSQRTINAAMSRENRGMTLHGLVDVVQAAAGRSRRHQKSGTEYADDLIAMLSTPMHLAASVGYSTINVAALVNDSINATIRYKFEQIPSVIPRCAVRRTVNSFREIKKFIIASGSFLNVVSSTGELDHMRIGESEYAYSPDTIGGMLTLQRKDIVNNEPDLIPAVGRMLAQRGAYTLERDFHKMLRSSDVTWRTSASAAGSINHLQGGLSAFGYAGVKKAVDTLSIQTDKQGNPVLLGGSPVLLVQAGGMELDAKELNKAETKRTSTATSTDQGDANAFFGMLTDVVGTPWFRNAAAMGTGSTDKCWYAFTNPSTGESAFEVAFLRASTDQSDAEAMIPRVEFGAVPFNSLGASARVVFDYGMGQVSDVGVVRCDGE